MESSQASQSRVYTDLNDWSAGSLEALLEAALECQPGHVLVKAVVFVTVAAALINLPVGSTDATQRRFVSAAVAWVD